MPLTAYYKNRSVVRADAFRVQQTDLELQQRTADIGDEKQVYVRAAYDYLAAEWKYERATGSL